MPIALTEDHTSLGHVTRDFAASNKLRGLTRATLDAPVVEVAAQFWTKTVQLGWPGLHLPDQFGGSGAGIPELAVVVDELGAAVAPGAVLTAAIGSAVVDACGSDELRARLLPQLATGSRVAAFAAGPDLTVSEGIVSGTVSVLGGVWAQHLLLAVGEDVVVVGVDSDGVDLVTASALDPSMGTARVTLKAAPGTVLAGQAARALGLARTVAAAEAAGGARACLTMALEYAKVREQFGRAIGSFQAIKHHLANMLVASERATAVAWDAARAATHTDGQAELAAAVAASVAFEAYVHNAQMNIQIHGGIGFTWEHDAHLYLRRARTLAAVFGEGADDEVYRSTAKGVRRDVNVELPPEAEQYRAEARTFADTFRAASKQQQRTLLVDSRYLVPHWPPPFGRGAGAIEQLVLEEEFAELDVPNLGIGGWVLLTLVQQATPDQIQAWIPPSLRGELVWCQLFSEPNAGSDAAAVQTKAVRVEGGWQITGQKVWTSGAQNCNRGLATVRTNTDVPKHKGITTVVVDLHADGVEVRPLREITGEALFNEVFFDDVFVADSDVVGEVDGGWTVARATLGNERVSIGGGGQLGIPATDLLAVLDQQRGSDPILRAGLGALIASEGALRAMNLRHVARAVVGGGPGAEGNITKLLNAEHMQAVSELAMAILGTAGVDGTNPELPRHYLLHRSMTIAGGTSEVSRNVIAERLLGLPREAIAN